MEDIKINIPGPQKSGKSETVNIRPARLEDMKQINDLFARIEYEVGEHIFTVYYLTSDSKWLVAVNDHGEMIGAYCINVLPLKSICYGFLMHVHEAYQNRGLIRRMGPIYTQKPIMGNATPQSLQLFPQMEKFEMKIWECIGHVDLNLLRDFPKNYAGQFSRTLSGISREKTEFCPLEISIVETTHDIDQVIAYDRSKIFLLDRDRFIRAWCTKSKSGEPYARTLVARRQNCVVGFGVLRRYSDYFALVPLYADDPTVAARLLLELARTFGDDCDQDKPLYVLFDARNYLMMEFAHRLKFKMRVCLTRHYARGAQEVKAYCRFDRVYSLSDYWPL